MISLVIIIAIIFFQPADTNTPYGAQPAVFYSAQLGSCLLSQMAQRHACYSDMDNTPHSRKSSRDYRELGRLFPCQARLPELSIIPEPEH